MSALRSKLVNQLNTKERRLASLIEVGKNSAFPSSRLVNQIWNLREQIDSIRAYIERVDRRLRRQQLQIDN